MPGEREGTWGWNFFFIASPFALFHAFPFWFFIQFFIIYLFGCGLYCICLFHSFLFLIKYIYMHTQTRHVNCSICFCVVFFFPLWEYCSFKTWLHKKMCLQQLWKWHFHWSYFNQLRGCFTHVFSFHTTLYVFLHFSPICISTHVFK